MLEINNIFQKGSFLEEDNYLEDVNLSMEKLGVGKLGENK